MSNFNKSIMQFFEECDILQGEILSEITDKNLSVMDNDIVEITEEDISALKEGKIIMCEGCEHTGFLFMKMKGEENENQI